VQAAGAAMNDPDILLIIHPHADGPAEQPVVGERLGPQRVNLEHRRDHGGALRLGAALEECLAQAERRDAAGERQAGH